MSYNWFYWKIIYFIVCFLLHSKYTYQYRTSRYIIQLKRTKIMSNLLLIHNLAMKLISCSPRVSAQINWGYDTVISIWLVVHFPRVSSGQAVWLVLKDNKRRTILSSDSIKLLRNRRCWLNCVKSMPLKNWSMANSNTTLLKSMLCFSMLRLILRIRFFMGL